MIKEVWIVVNYNLYESKRHFCVKLAEAFQRQGVVARIIDVERDQAANWFQKHQGPNPPSLWCSFNRTVPYPDGTFFWDHHKMPFLSILVDPVFYDLEIALSPFSIISCVDQLDCELLRNRNFNNVFFWPHAVERELAPDPHQPRDYDVVFLGSSYDPEGLRRGWQDKYPEHIGQVIDEAAEISLSERATPFWEAVLKTLDRHKIDRQQVDFTNIVRYVDNYIRGVDRLELIRAIKDVPVHVFGGTCWRDEQPIKGWAQCLGSQPNVLVHPAIPFQETFEVLKRSKICLNSMPFFKAGTHERMFMGLACGSLPITTDNLWVQENFVDGQELVLYRPKFWDEVNAKVHHFLDHEQERQEVVERGRAKVMREHTWDKRVEQFLQVIPPILERITHETP